MSEILIAYFSHAGQNYSHGSIKELKVGNTEVVAKKIQKLTGGDLFYIDTIKQYPNDHMEKIKIAKEEYESNARPALKNTIPDFEKYDEIYLGFPNWWTTMPMALFTFLECYDFSNKTIYPFITHGGSGFSDSIQDIKRLVPNAIVKSGLAINGDMVQYCDKELEDWIKGGK